MDTVLDCLCSRFAAVSRAEWVESHGARPRTRRRSPRHRREDPYRPGLVVTYFREVPQEAPIPGVERLLYVDEHLVVADKPHFLPVIPAGRFVRETLLTRLIARLHNPDLVPLHRIDAVRRAW
jgi:tRNA pseudouridine32 synthase/23S rRNA pseudouridine746 synthase